MENPKHVEDKSLIDRDQISDDIDADTHDDAWSYPEPLSQKASEIFIVDIEGFEGPLDLLLELARTQKVDLEHISVAELAAQYLDFIMQYQVKNIEIAGDYLVMAAWLTYLKSRLLVPDEADFEEESPEELAEALKKRLLHLEKIRFGVRELNEQPQLGVDFFARGMPETHIASVQARFDVTLFELLKAYGQQKQRNSIRSVNIVKRPAWPLEMARDVLIDAFSDEKNWVRLEAGLATYLDDPEIAKTALASSFAACLDLIRQNRLDVFQSETFGPLLLRRSKGEVSHMDKDESGRKISA